MVDMLYNKRYRKLWKKMDELKVTKKELEYMAHLPKFTLYGMKIGIPVSLEYLMRICNILHCELREIVDIEV